jgi:copper chaperone
MENKEFQFKTNINCGGCVASVKPHLNNAEGVCEWNVDTTNKDKILTVKSEGITEEQVLGIIKKSGFKAEPLTV